MAQEFSVSYSRAKGEPMEKFIERINRQTIGRIEELREPFRCRVLLAEVLRTLDRIEERQVASNIKEVSVE